MMDRVCRGPCRNKHYSTKGVTRSKIDRTVFYALRALLARTQDNLCGICGLELPRVLHQATVDHVIPLSLGGRDGLGNLVAAHKPCNLWKANDIPTGCEMIWLLMVNAKQGVTPVVF